MRPRRTFLALAAVAVLSGCGGAAESAPPSPTAGDKKHQLEAAKADCMKQKGFKYVAFVSKQKWALQDDKRDSGDYSVMRKFREKYGFGVFAMHVYPKEFGNPAVKPDNPEINPNWAIQSSLSKTQMSAYRKASDACMAVAVKQVLGLDVKSDMDYYAQLNKASNRAIESTLNSDPRLVELASAMATCLKGKGYSISDTTPKALSERGTKQFADQEDRLGRAQRDDIPDVPPPLKEGEIPMRYSPTLTPEEARPYLAKEIKAALDDLECGKDFYAAYLPKDLAIQKQIYEQFGM
ncbi:hypothetical protein EDD27_8412 [Nonomuraea polychroma]|uniref:Lipoprotein n=1 Tax=Nonomuraea polychroma TaxID=46176 RepID=A0A438MI72_9ACTN|nr:hypothetical protein [Nonomuraea polychroma]RVX45600.1 hypothetical protein EDD27_8412 [Nonomuraea polychroma]